MRDETTNPKCDPVYEKCAACPEQRSCEDLRYKARAMGQARDVILYLTQLRDVPTTPREMIDALLMAVVLITDSSQSFDGGSAAVEHSEVLLRLAQLSGAHVEHVEIVDAAPVAHAKEVN
jgi:hypothetical protein